MDNRLVLIIDDCELDGQIVANVVEKAGGMPFVANSKALTSEMIDICKFDAMSIDINLANGEKGHRLFQELELFNAIKGVSKRVVAVTGQDLDEVETQQLMEMGFYAVFPKPFDANALTQALGLSEKPTVSLFEGMVA